ncbi:Life-span regulatory factor domain-containing protein [Pleurostoma richardsiae]|uniref:Life-span regulatory factor domain-containing protein n=1 Tax=Pleurostoma richardsiae TaxID=41990 RepID=A0AA38VXN7_9PEZI|nr:Life-span regulatory factor domain-containing protein [Pleurostoma richardsiae]
MPHHYRRKSGHGSANTSLTDVRKAVAVSEPSTRHKSSRPPPMTRRVTPQAALKLGKNPRDREREWEDERWWEEERESFPQFCMTCEKQFVPQDDRFLYCSEACRIYDQNNASVANVALSRGGHSPSASYPFYAAGDPEPRDIIPRASPSRPSSTHLSPPTTPSAAPSQTSAISALRSLHIRPPSPPSPTGTYHPSIWPFTRSAATSPSTSFSRPPSGLFSSTYDGYYGVAGYTMTSPSMDRPLPSRRPGGYARPKSIELVTPMVGQ